MAKKQFRIFGTIVNDDSERWAAEDVTPAQFANFLKFADPADEVELMINSPGGSVTAGLAIANMVKTAKQSITARVYGIAASMASVVATAAPKLAMFKSSFMMVHNPWTVMMGDSNALKKEAAVLDSMKAAIMGFYQSKFPTLKAEELSALMDEETWILGSEASAYGLAADIEDDIAQAAACVHGPAVFAKIPDAAKKFYAGDPNMKHLAPPPPKSPDVVALSEQIDALKARVEKAETECAAHETTIAALTTERDEAKTAAENAESQRRDHQSRADRLAQELEQAKADAKTASDKSAAKISELETEKGALEKRVASITLNALKTPDHGCAQTWDEALVECGSYESAKRKYPHLAEAYRLAHSSKGSDSDGR